jgi:hypothetical protein
MNDKPRKHDEFPVGSFVPETLRHKHWCRTLEATDLNVALAASRQTAKSISALELFREGTLMLQANRASESAKTLSKIAESKDDGLGHADVPELSRGGQIKFLEAKQGLPDHPMILV